MTKQDRKEPSYRGTIDGSKKYLVEIENRGLGPNQKEMPQNADFIVARQWEKDETNESCYYQVTMGPYRESYDFDRSLVIITDGYYNKLRICQDCSYTELECIC